eukprot:TRINITY_DN463_c0_g1_i2.p1 TRINITY_DN463_c0_g1~~TRINITY_DN463_c0_g1_i2.p1  ORF type:complete len:219 (+),score=47.68 TRINITY_DN463_c0_g1_i2:169-825(+)
MTTLQPVFTVSDSEGKLPRIASLLKPCSKELPNSRQPKLKRPPTAEDTEVTKASESRNGRWTRDECRRFEEALRKFGKHWKKVEAYVGTRSGTQVRSHAQKYFLRQRQQNKGAGSGELDSSAVNSTFVQATQNEADATARKESSENSVILEHTTLTLNQSQSAFKLFEKKIDSMIIPKMETRISLKAECKYLLERMKIYKNIEEIYATYTKLSDWVAF